MASNSSNPDISDTKDSRWYFTAEQLANSPSRRHGIEADQELSYRQQTAYLIQEMGQRLQVSQLCINTAIVYMHRFYAFHSFTHFHRNGIAMASLFLAAKVEEQPRKLEHVIKVAHMCLSQDAPHPGTDVYAEQSQDLVFNENVLLQTLGFDVAIDHPHTHVVKTCHLVKACKDLAQTSYFLASNSLHLTPMCLQYRPTVVACFCIYLACKWSRWEIPQSTEGKHWFHYVDKTVTMDLLKQLTDEFIAIYEKSPARLKTKLNNIKALAQGARITEPSRPIPESSNSASSQLSQLEPVRRPESYSSHHRHHSSSGSHSATSHHHHHSKQLPPGEQGDHAGSKPSTSQKQQYGSSGIHYNRPRPERFQGPPADFNVPSQHGNSKQPIPPNAPRPSNSNRQLHGMPIPGGPNYPKARNPVPPQLNPPVVGHKTMPKVADQQQQQQRNVMKDSSGRAVDPGKIPSKHSNSGSSSSNNSNNNSSTNMYPPSNSNSSGIDMTRNVLQPGSNPIQQRPYNTHSNSSQLPNYNQAVSSRSSSSSSAKYDQSVQQQQHLQQSQKQSLESSFSTTNTRQLDESNKMSDQMEICSPPKYQYQQAPPHSQSIQQQQQQPPPTLSKSSSIFSPEWNEKATHSNVNASSNTNNGSNNSSKTLGLGIKSSRDSPKKERRSETPKKEKIRSEQQMLDPSKQSYQMEKRISGGKKLPDPVIAPNIQNISGGYESRNPMQQALNLSGIKRPLPNEQTNRFDEEPFRELKVRKIGTSPLSSLAPYYETIDDAKSMKSFPNTFNGIETDPTLVSSLLKESLCTDNKFGAPGFIKPEITIKDEMKDLIEPMEMGALPAIIMQFDSPAKEEPAIPVLDDYSKSKAEKKKKKDKHKHKEKDKSKDKEEKKKHKKDKDKHKDRERLSGSETIQNPVKITIPKEKLNIPIVDTFLPQSGVKITIPKDRIKGELINYQIEGNNPLPPQPLRIKISKDKIENYNHQQQSSSSSYSGNNYHSHSSSKKKDRDRDKDKKSRNSNNEHNKQNGNGNNNGGSGVSGSSTSTKSQTSSNSSSKMQQSSSNMSQLFGESNDDDNSLSPEILPQQQTFRY